MEKKNIRLDSAERASLFEMNTDDFSTANASTSGRLKVAAPAPRGDRPKVGAPAPRPQGHKIGAPVHDRVIGENRISAPDRRVF
jgi:hypothetical protein